MADEKRDITFGTKADFQTRGPGGATAGRSDGWRASIRHLLTDADLVAHYQLRDGENVASIVSAISDAGNLEGVGHSLKISSSTADGSPGTVVSYWIVPSINLPEETPEQEAVDPG